MSTLRDEIAVYLTMSIEDNSYKRADTIVAMVRDHLTADDADRWGADAMALTEIADGSCTYSDMYQRAVVAAMDAG